MCKLLSCNVFFFIFLLFLFGNKLYKMITLAKKVNNIYKYFRLNQIVGISRERFTILKPRFITIESIVSMLQKNEISKYENSKDNINVKTNFKI